MPVSLHHIRELLLPGLRAMTMIYSIQEAKSLAEQVVEDAKTEAELKGTELPEAEKDRLWKLVMDACK
jgi:hypothetical protein